MRKNPSNPVDLPEVQFSEEGSVRHLHLGTPWIQGSMDQDEPLRLVHEYIQRMMAWMLFVEPDTLGRRQSVQLGLGAGSLTKYCARVLRMKRTTAIELNPAVLHACRGWFQLPANSARLQVLLGDAHQNIREPQWRGAVDALQVDLYDDEAAAPVLDSADFYADCRAALTEDGCMTVNLFGHRSSLERSVGQMAQAFGRDAIWAFKPTREGNTVVLAQRTAYRPARALMAERASTIEALWGLPAPKWVRVLRPLEPA